MAYEATLVTTYDLPVSKTVADGNAITKGSILKITDPNTVAITAGAVDQIVGIAATDKIASDGVTQLGVYQSGIWKVYLSGSCTVGDPLVTDAVANYVKTAKTLTAAQASGNCILGFALETGTTGETILMELKPQAWRGVAT